MDQTELENKIIHRNPLECGNDPDLGRTVRLSTAGIYKVSVEVEQKHATNLALVTAKSI